MLTNYLRVLQRRKYTIVTVVVIMMGFALFYNFTATKIYQARSSIIIRRANPISTFRGSKLSFPNFVAERAEYETKLKIITTRPILEKLVHKMIEKGHWSHLNLPELSEDEKKKLITRKANSIGGKVTVDAIKKTNLVNLFVRHPNRLMAAEIANNLAEILVERNLSEQRRMANSSLTFLSEQLDEARVKLEEAESKLYEYKAKHEIFDTDYDKELVADKRYTLEGDLIQATGKRKGIEAQISEIKRLLQKKDYSRYTPVVSDETNDILSKLNVKLVDSEVRYEMLCHKYKSQHPEVIEAAERIRILQEKFEGELRKGIRKLEFDRNVLLSREKVVGDALSSFSNRAILETRKDIEYGVLDREALSARELFHTLLGAVKEANINLNSFFGETTQVHEYALVPNVNSPIWPKEVLNLMVGLFIGMAFGIGFAILLESLDRTVKSPEDVEIHTRLPILTLLPKISESQADIAKYRLMVLEHPKSLFSEGILNLRANLRLDAVNERISTLLVSSSGPREGKSLIAANLAVAMAQEGVRTLLIDADLRRPVVHRIFRLDKSKGLTQSIIDLFQSDISDMDFSQLSFGDLHMLMELQRRSGVVYLNINHGSTPLQFLYQQGRVVASNLEEWQKRLNLGDGDNFDDMRLQYEEDTKPSSLLPMVAVEDVKRFFTDFPQLHDASFLAGALYDNYTHETPMDNLRVLLSGPVPSNPSEILGSKQMSEIVRLMKTKVDLIVFDTAPCWPLSDVSLLSPLGDALVYVVRSGKVSKDLLARNIQQLRQLEVKVLGVVFNDIDFQKDRYYYYGYYSHYYHYYYHYYYDHGPEDRAG
jgi:uncharacterized protein involved in exopolysaccharide biosynthesis/Mrp family chromosome partitioning ATPase